ncbi:MAG: hypothetical protein K6B13_09315, partial [Prevotella sp.]|nr:hypothetical protein [Prevotella sp.]
MKSNWFERLFLSVLAFLLAQSLPAQVTGTLSYRRYTTQDGLPQMMTETLFQDARGYIYVGTLSGLVRYDGRTFTPFLQGHRWNIVQFMEDDEGVRALSFRRQWRIDGDEASISPIDPQGHWLLNNFNASDLPNGYLLFEDDQEQHRWVGKATVSQGFTRFYENERLDQMLPDRKLYVDGTSFYIPTTEGLYRDQQLISSNPDFYSLCRQGHSLYAFAQDGIYSVESDSVRLLTPFDEWQADYGLTVRPAKDGTLLIADAHSLYIYDSTPNPQPSAPSPSGKSGRVTKLAGGFNLIKGMLVDRWDRLWLTTYQGLYCFFNRHFTNHTLDDPDDIVRGVGVSPSTDTARQTVAQPIMGTLNGKIISGGRIIYDNPNDFFQPCAAVIDSSVYLAGRNDIACVSDSTVTWLGLPFERYQFITEAGRRLIIGTRQLIASYDPVTQ